MTIVEFGRSPVGGDFYVVTSDAVRHEIPEALARAHFDLIDLHLPYPFVDDAYDYAVCLRPKAEGLDEVEEQVRA